MLYITDITGYICAKITIISQGKFTVSALHISHNYSIRRTSFCSFKSLQNFVDATEVELCASKNGQYKTTRVWLTVKSNFVRKMKSKNKIKSKVHITCQLGIDYNFWGPFQTTLYTTFHIQLGLNVQKINN